MRAEGRARSPPTESILPTPPSTAPKPTRAPRGSRGNAATRSMDHRVTRNGNSGGGVPGVAGSRARRSSSGAGGTGRSTRAGGIAATSAAGVSAGYHAGEALEIRLPLVQVSGSVGRIPGGERKCQVPFRFSERCSTRVERRCVARSGAKRWKSSFRMFRVGPMAQVSLWSFELDGCRVHGTGKDFPIPEHLTSEDRPSFTRVGGGRLPVPHVLAQWPAWGLVSAWKNKGFYFWGYSSACGEFHYWS